MSSAGGGLSEWTEHLEELRRRIIAVLAVFTVISVPAFVFSDYLATFLMAPVADLGVALYTFDPAEKFLAYLHLAMWTGAVVSAPFCLLQIGLFVWPALQGKERQWTVAALAVVPVLFIAGAAAAYRFLSPTVLRFFLGFSSGDGIQPLWGFKEYLAMLFALMLATGLLLQTPLLLLAAFVLGIVTPKTVARFRPHIIFLIFLAAALCTPPDVISQVALGVPLYLLFELTLFIGRFFTKRI
ncbi:Sec-independent protein translocase protein TatC [Spirochaetia bacterium]|nr:Sec-independent protein translocase protein TatC [Spirochaetia bacterium]GHU34375.1 Sec-independent protein translocase protein TatC [Spirochaetia bacterium]